MQHYANEAIRVVQDLCKSRDLVILFYFEVNYAIMTLQELCKSCRVPVIIFYVILLFYFLVNYTIMTLQELYKTCASLVGRSVIFILLYLGAKWHNSCARVLLYLGLPVQHWLAEEAYIFCCWALFIYFFLPRELIDENRPSSRPPILQNETRRWRCS